jgi:mannosyltransferase
MASALRPIKAVDEFIDVVEHIGATDDRVVGLIAGGIVPGEEGYAEHIKERVARSPLGSRLRFLGHLDEVAPFLQALDVFVSTSHYETFGNSVCEAMACRVAVVAYTGGSVGEVVGDAGLVVPTGDVSGLTSATQRLVSDTSARADAAGRGYARATSEFSPRRSFDLLRQIYERVGVQG